ncbi:MAG TPA: type II secretion system minor pseudopilin GspI [Chthonomonadales bacterium]|nr:type II secretion system minor pseudopilin GspI [Chthonomonadales bacterium]
MLCRSRGRRRCARGFTLIEMVVATIVLFIGGVAALSCMGLATRAIGSARDHQTAAVLAQDRLAQMSLSAADLTAGDEEGTFGDEHPGFAWQQSIESTDVTGLLRVTLTVSWPVGTRSRSVAFVTHLRGGVQP